MTNTQIAEVLNELALLLEIKGESVFKIRAYQRAAEAVTSLAQDLSQVRTEKGGLQTLPGIGQAISQKIEELLDTGQCHYHQELLTAIPATALEMLRIPGIGPKKVKLLLEQEGIATVEQLEQAAQAGLLRTLPGMGEKSEQDILRGIAHLREYNQRTDLGLAWEIAENVMGQLKAAAPLQRIEAAGSLRRMKETIGDLDLLATSADPEAVMAAFISLPTVTEVIGHGPTKSSVRTAAGLQVDLRVVPGESFGAAWQYFTGSKQHNIALRDLAMRHGFKLNEYGVFAVSGEVEQRIGGATEEEVYAALGLPVMPPELREDQGELEAARAGCLPTLVEQADLRGELHAHTTWSDGRNSIEEMARAALEAGYEYLALTDHSQSQTIANGMKIDRLMERRKAIEAARQAVPEVTILEGAEVDIKKDGSLDYPDEVLAGLDFVVASVHSGWKMKREVMTRRIITAMEHRWVDSIGHPTGRLIGQREPYEVDMEAVLQAAARLGVAMEISSDPMRLDLRDTHARRAKELGVTVTIVTDAHWIENLAFARFGVATARRGWIERGDVLNCLPLDELRKRLRRSHTR